MALHPTRRSILAGATLAGLLPAAPGLAQEVTGRAPVVGAGSTFAYPVVSRWAKGYHRWVAGGGTIPIAGGGLDDPPSGAMLDYEPIGSLAGIMRVKERAVDFGASEMPLKSEELRKLGLVQFPLVIGGIVAVVNIDGVGPGQLRLTGQVLADIFLGKVENWSDPAIKALNPQIALPDAKIVVVRRSDGSGTTFNFTDFLSKASPLWKEKVGSDLLVTWPVGTIGAKGNDGVSRTVRQTRNSIGYVEFAHAQQNRLAYALVRNPAGNFVVPSPQAFQTAAAHGRLEGSRRLRAAADRHAGRRRLPDGRDGVRAHEQGHVGAAPDGRAQLLRLVPRTRAAPRPRRWATCRCRRTWSPP